jgi:hypothetical protein
MPPTGDSRAEHLAAGLLRTVVDRAEALARADGLDKVHPRLAPRGGRVALLAVEPLLLDAAEAAARRADAFAAEAVATVADSGELPRHPDSGNASPDGEAHADGRRVGRSLARTCVSPGRPQRTTRQPERSFPAVIPNDPTAVRRVAG